MKPLLEHMPGHILSYMLKHVSNRYMPEYVLKHVPKHVLWHMSRHVPKQVLKRMVHAVLMTQGVGSICLVFLLNTVAAEVLVISNQNRCDDLAAVHYRLAHTVLMI